MHNSSFFSFLSFIFLLSSQSSSAAEEIRILLKETHMAHEIIVNSSVYSLLIRGVLPSNKKIQLRLNFPSSSINSELKKDCFKSAKLAAIDSKLGFETYINGLSATTGVVDPRGYQNLIIDFPSQPGTVFSAGCGIINLNRTNTVGYSFPWFDF